MRLKKRAFCNNPLEMKQKNPKPEQQPKKPCGFLVIHKKTSSVPKVTEEVNSFKINTVRQKLRKMRQSCYHTSSVQITHNIKRAGKANKL